MSKQELLDKTKDLFTDDNGDITWRSHFDAISFLSAELVKELQKQPKDTVKSILASGVLLSTIAEVYHTNSLEELKENYLKGVERICNHFAQCKDQLVSKNLEELSEAVESADHIFKIGRFATKEIYSHYREHESDFNEESRDSIRGLLGILSVYFLTREVVGRLQPDPYIYYLQFEALSDNYLKSA